MDKKFRKKERLCSRKTVGKLFESGKMLKRFPFKIIYSCDSYDQSPVKIAVSVPKKIHKRAVKRNFIRRRIKEAYRLNKRILYEAIEQKITLNIIVIYISSNIEGYAEIEKKFTGVLPVLLEHVKKDIDNCPGNSD
ncbi:MAG: ribonuclease P protein component [Prevotellaceae bacterium]|nr:ribonuclease P protein component [Prevotellaceae bacterium]